MNAIIQTEKLNSNFIKLAKTIVINDGKQFKNQHSEYALNPKAEIRESLALLKDKPIWKERYEEFIEGMVYDTTNVFPYDQAMRVLEGMSVNILASL